MSQILTKEEIATGVKIFAGVLGGYFLFSGYWIGIIVLAPVIFVDMIFSRFKYQGLSISTVGNLFKIFLILQGLVVWYLAKNKSYDAPIVGGAVFVDSTKVTGAGKFVFPVKIVAEVPGQIHEHSYPLLESVVGALPAVDFPDLKYRNPESIYNAHPLIYGNLPEEGFSQNYKNPCWEHNGDLQCLPYAYVLGQPKSGTSDLYERLKKHDDISLPRVKEIRWFTKGEFVKGKMQYDNEPTAQRAGGAGGGHDQQGGRGGRGRGDSPKNEKRLGKASNILSFTERFAENTKVIAVNPQSTISIDGGPHTLWWPTQMPDGTFTDDVPPQLLIKNIQPDAKFIITLTDPVKRMYSDYYFLNDDLGVVHAGQKNGKSAHQFHKRSLEQIVLFNQCIEDYKKAMKDNSRYEYDHVAELPLWFRAAQMCAHDRHRFGAAGWGRITISLYALHLAKWLESFAPSQFLVVRLEDYAENPKAYMTGIFKFLELEEPSSWDDIIADEHANQARTAREPLLAETESALREFFRPYNEILSQLLGSDSFLWEPPLNNNGEAITLHDKQVADAAKDAGKAPVSGGRDGGSVPGGGRGREGGRGHPPGGRDGSGRGGDRGEGNGGRDGGGRGDRGGNPEGGRSGRGRGGGDPNERGGSGDSGGGPPRGGGRGGGRPGGGRGGGDGGEGGF